MRDLGSDVFSLDFVKGGGRRESISLNFSSLGCQAPTCYDVLAMAAEALRLRPRVLLAFVVACFLLTDHATCYGTTVPNLSTSDPSVGMSSPLLPLSTVGNFRVLSYGSDDEGTGEFFSGFDTDNSIPDGFCKTWIGTLVAVNATWEEHHCRKCRCDVMMGAVCENPQCAIAFHPYLETNCEEWSSDSCCCIRSACVHEGKHYAADDWFVLTYDDPCTLCQCNPSDGLPSCVLTKCPSLGCVDAKQVPGLCCPVCTSGLNCAIPSLPLSDGEHDLTPLPVSTWRLFNATNIDAPNWNCTCNNPGEPADCTEAEGNSTKTMDKGVNLRPNSAELDSSSLPLTMPQ